MTMIKIKRGTLGGKQVMCVIYILTNPLMLMLMLSSTAQALPWGTPTRCEDKWGGLLLRYTKGTPTTFLFDLCDVIDCGGQNASYRGYDVWLCDSQRFNEACQEGWSSLESICAWWEQVAKYTGPWVPTGPIQYADWWRNVSFSREGYTGHSGLNPLALSLGNYQSGSDGADMLYVLLGVDQSGRDPFGVLWIQFIDPPPPDRQPDTPRDRVLPVVPFRPKNDSRVLQVNYNRLNPRDVIELATGYTDRNIWLDWLEQTAREQCMEGCVACAAARPQLFTEPAPFHLSDPWGYSCMLALTREVNPLGCDALAALYPPIDPRTRPGPFTPQKAGGRYLCFNFTGTGPHVGDIPTDWCMCIQQDGSGQIGHVARAGLFWYCGQDKLRVRMSFSGVGLCAMVRLGAPLTLIGERSPREVKVEGTPGREKRGAHHFDLTVNSVTYIDAIGVPRGVPD
ncbi:uncharacterized protein LOC125715651 [Brienomyrus brachyistius]|uniref:uncharacterized protein LOC125715651 n=1 Tax=Brienomyrus brachyistius TaxID=42636 RepID=UPI0020B30E5A|nr:uncharacterized protein LOC125715651 [Brienomyrus brachyistius]XP_048843417.1 uncharacterized protein LOC125715651 [Brienomyrus brachyistius]XP_048843425.1 uncharacterized protein LOC125715651 [Brienomyrus brachyistius]